MKNENWERFLPHFKNRNVQRKKKVKKAGKQRKTVELWAYGMHDLQAEVKKKSKDVFPPQPMPRKEAGATLASQRLGLVDANVSWHRISKWRRVSTFSMLLGGSFG